MNSSLYNTHVKLLAFDFLNLKPNRSDPSSFSRNATRLSRAEALGVVVWRDHKPTKFLRFSIDDGTGVIQCVLWLNQLNSPYFSRRHPSDVRLIAEAAQNFAAEVQLGVVARVRGKISGYRGALQITVADVVVEKDPNMEVFHWLDCVRLARECYDEVKDVTMANTSSSVPF